MDADLSVSLDQIPHLLAPLSNGADMVFGSRQHKHSNIVLSQHFLRQKSGSIFNLLIRCLLFYGVRDTQCGFKGFSSKAANYCFDHCKSNRFAFDVELFLLVSKQHLSIYCIPVNWKNVVHSSVSFWKDSVKMFFHLLVLKWRFKIFIPFKIEIKTNEASINYHH